MMLLQDGKDEHDDDEDEDNTDSNRVDSDTPSPARGFDGNIRRSKNFPLRLASISEKVIARVYGVVRSHSKILVACVQQAANVLSTERFCAASAVRKRSLQKYRSHHQV